MDPTNRTKPEKPGGHRTGNQKTCIKKQYKHTLEFSNHHTPAPPQSPEENHSRTGQQDVNIHKHSRPRKSAGSAKPGPLEITRTPRRVATWAKHTQHPQCNPARTCHNPKNPSLPNHSPTGIQQFTPHSPTTRRLHHFPGADSPRNTLSGCITGENDAQGRPHLHPRAMAPRNGPAQWRRWPSKRARHWCVLSDRASCANRSATCCTWMRVASLAKSAQALLP